MSSVAAPKRHVAIGSSAIIASTNAMPNGSGPTFGWRWNSAAANKSGLWLRSPKNRTLSDIPRDSAWHFKASS
jgi:hypothetical protein